MLPDLPRFKSKLDQAFTDYLRARVNAKMGVFNQSPKHIIHEGEEMEVIRSDGSTEITGLNSASTEWRIDQSSVPTISMADRLAKLDAAADQMAEQIVNGLLHSLDHSLGAAGRTISGGGKPFDVEAYFAGLEAIAWEFDENGKAGELSIVISPHLKESARKILASLERDAALQARYESLVSKKRMEWREREAARKLVG